MSYQRNPLPDEASELFHYAHTNPKGMRHLEASFRCLEGHKRAGRYDRAKALKLILRNSRDVAAEYARDYLKDISDWPLHFPVSVRDRWAEQVLDFFEAELDAGNSYLGASSDTPKPILPEYLPDHVAHVEGDEYTCTRCHKRWGINDKEIPPCV